METKRLNVQIVEPGVMPNRTSRFDRAGFISEIILDGDIHFCASEPRNLAHPSSGGRGLCSEFLFDTSVGVPVGGYFPKFGIGLLKKETEEPYAFYRRYRETPFWIDVERDKNAMAFVTEPVMCNGYAVRNTKRIVVSDRSLCITQTASNVGEKDIAMQEYNHNMISIDGMAIGPDYRLTLHDCSRIPDGPMPEETEGYAGNFECVDGDIRNRSYSGVASVCTIPAEAYTGTNVFRWTLEQRAAGAKIDVEECFCPSAVYLWAVDHVFSLEALHDIRLSPGESHTWERVRTFDRI